MNDKYIFIAFSKGGGAVSEQFNALIGELISRGYCVVCIVDGRRNDLIDEVNNPKTFTWPSKRPSKLIDGIFIFKLIARFKPLITIANFGSVNWMLLASWLQRVPVRVAWYRTIYQHNLNSFQTNTAIKFQTFRKSIIYTLATDIITNSQASRQDINNVFQVPMKKISVFYNNLADPKISNEKKSIKSEKPMIICPGRFVQSKGQDVLIQAVAKVVHLFPDLVVVFLGDGPDREKCKQLAEKKNLSSNCIFPGSCSHEQVIAQMSQAWITVVPSRHEAFGYVNIESMSVGTAVIASNVGGIPEIIRNETDGYLIPPDAPDILAEKIMILLSDPELRRYFGFNARQRYLSMFEQTTGVKAQANWLEDKVQTDIK